MHRTGLIFLDLVSGHFIHHGLLQAAVSVSCGTGILQAAVWADQLLRAATVSLSLVKSKVKFSKEEFIVAEKVINYNYEFIIKQLLSPAITVTV